MNAFDQNQLFEAMASPGVYPHAVGSVVLKETHISMVFLTGDAVYKIKKAIDLGFLDFSSPEKRRRCCELEVALNRRLTDGVYRGVVPITRVKNGFQLFGSGPVVDYAVRMRQLPHRWSLSEMLRDGRVSARHIAALSRCLADFFVRQGPVAPDVAAGAWQRIHSACEANFNHTRWAVGNLLDQHQYRAVQSATRAFLSRRRQLIDHRSAKGKIYDGHGDLRSGHIYFSDDHTLQIIDCIEFNADLRHIDVASDLAFLAMDLDVRGAPALSAQLVDRYVHITRDWQAYALLPFYMCYRAMVRCKVNCIRMRSTAGDSAVWSDSHRSAAMYLAGAYRYAAHFARPQLRVFCGVPGAGKSTLARVLSKMLKVAVVRSDMIRKQYVTQYSPSGQTGAGTANYSQKTHRLVYDKLLQRAAGTLARGEPIILDATFSDPEHRRRAVDLADTMKCPIVFIECTAPERLLRSRLALREGRRPISDARLHHFQELQQRFIPLHEIEPAIRFRVDTARPMRECIRDLLSRSFHAVLAGADTAETFPARNVSKGGRHVQDNSGGNRLRHRTRSRGGRGSPSRRRERRPVCDPPRS